jgi:hypothetical protein
MVTTFNEPLGRLAVMQKRGLLIALVGLLVAFFGGLEGSWYWEEFLRTTGAFLTAAGLLLVLYSLVRD